MTVQTTSAAATDATPEHLEHRVTLPDGRLLALAEWGDPAGLPLVAIHGTPGSRIACWEDPTIYARHGLRRLTFDRPGYGASTAAHGDWLVTHIPGAIAEVSELGHLGDDDQVERHTAWLARGELRRSGLGDRRAGR